MLAKKLICTLAKGYYLENYCRDISISLRFSLFNFIMMINCDATEFKTLLKEYASIRVERNFSMVEKIFQHDLTYMSSLLTIRFEILNCLIMEFNNASITLTNHFVERMLKLSLIELETKDITLSEPEKYASMIKHAHEQFDHLKLHDTLKHNKHKGLISEEEFSYLSSTGKTLRDSYSHAQVGVINANQPTTLSGHMFDISDVEEKLRKGESNFMTNKIDLPSIAPTVAQLYQSDSARENAFEYFSKVYDILINIESRLKNK